ncbi:9901_t:CDS:1 [Acaulospora colombiana]|uniref:9901_t:CDS:1 n=1 Tax=Acaulospora colombiana TaxID=27376 RepID=A0ACA9PCC6_9GLOM|nr:9901_t:CDS:1 [Acaulospora colombiana]
MSDLLKCVLPNIKTSLLQVENTTGRSTPLHWAAVNAHLAVAQALVSHPNGPGPLLIDAHNAAGLSPLGEAELAGADDVAKWFVEVMNIRQEDIMEAETTEEIDTSKGDEAQKVVQGKKLPDGVKNMTLEEKDKSKAS